MVVALALVFATGVLTFVRPLWVGRFAPSSGRKRLLKVEIRPGAHDTQREARQSRLRRNPLVADNGQRVAAGDIVAGYLALSEPDLRGSSPQPSAASSSHRRRRPRHRRSARTAVCVVSYRMDGLEGHERVPSRHPRHHSIIPARAKAHRMATSSGWAGGVPRDHRPSHRASLPTSTTKSSRRQVGRVRFPAGAGRVNATVRRNPARPGRRLARGAHRHRQVRPHLADLRLERAILIPALYKASGSLHPWSSATATPACTYTAPAGTCSVP